MTLYRQGALAKEWRLTHLGFLGQTDFAKWYGHSHCTMLLGQGDVQPHKSILMSLPVRLVIHEARWTRFISPISNSYGLYRAKKVRLHGALTINKGQQFSGPDNLVVPPCSYHEQGLLN